MDYQQVSDMFKGVKDKEHARRIIKKFKSLSQIYTKTLKVKGVHIGFIIGFFGWEKWQNRTTPSTTLQTTPKAANLKALQGGKTTPQTTPLTTHINNNDINNKLVSKDTCQNSEEFSPAQLPKVPHQEIINLFGEILPSLPQPKKLTAARQKSIRARHMNDLKADVNNWRKYFTYIRDNCQWMLSGQYNVDFDYVIRQSTFVKILEGAKDDRK